MQKTIVFLNSLLTIQYGSKDKKIKTIVHYNMYRISLSREKIVFDEHREETEDKKNNNNKKERFMQTKSGNDSRIRVHSRM